ncbi:hypothetical protein BIY24_15055 [Halobacteriovorax marinus]|uniref:NUDIX domain-containing protein n=1 Tax=Halobacteriovorax marinus TaxID=97084 RepID=UPI000BC35490|nr:NUDIX domain-containing protein [Halobacteriovorax marinus]ATH09213.1 hypothetical protein BIY24_15055 [Halobacteriovorax marinus]
MVTPVSIVILIRSIEKGSLELWMQERVEDGPLNGLLEFPGGKIEAGEDSHQAAHREFLEEASVSLSKTFLFKIKTHTYKDRSVCLFVHFAQGGDVSPANGQWFKFNFNEMSLPYKERLPEVNYEIIDDLLNYIDRHQRAEMLENIWAQKS